MHRHLWWPMTLKQEALWEREQETRTERVTRLEWGRTGPGGEGPGRGTGQKEQEGHHPRSRGECCRKAK